MNKKIRLSGTISGAEDPNRPIRAETLYRLFASGWDIYNSNGDQQITLNNIEKKIIESNAFMFMPGATLDDLFKAISIFVGYQTLDPNLQNKTTVILNTDHSWDPLFILLDTLKAQGTINQDYRDYLLDVQSVDSALIHLSHMTHENTQVFQKKAAPNHKLESFTHEHEYELLSHVCVFCSASIKDQDFLDEGYQLGKALAHNQLGCVSGAGKTGVMGEVVRGCIDANGWAAGSNIPHIIELEGLPDGLSEFWLREDIYTRMEVMIEKSQAFVIFPGGAGTVQELLALLIFKKSNHPLMNNKSIIIYNKRVDSDNGFWDGLLDMLAPYTDSSTYLVADHFEDLIDKVQKTTTHLHYTTSDKNNSSHHLNDMR